MHDIRLSNEDIMAKQEERAERNRSRLSEYDVRAYNILGAIGSGKTALIEAMAEELKSDLAVGAVAGDVAGDDDYRRFREAGIPSYNLNTSSDCHLDAHLVEHSLDSLPLDDLDVLFIENVGNLVCPADFPLGTDSDVVVISVTEGEDMVRKHPKIFSQTDLVVINKIDLAEIIGVDPEVPRDDYMDINPNGNVIFSVATEGRGVRELIQLLELRP